MVSRSSVAERRARPIQEVGRRPAGRKLELALLAGASLLFAAALALTCAATWNRNGQVAPGTINLSAVDRSEQILPLLDMFPSTTERQFAARKILQFIREQGGLPNVGSLSRIRVADREIQRSFRVLSERRREMRTESVPLLSGSDVARLKSKVIVRQPRAFAMSLVLWPALMLICFYAVHVFWSLRGFRGEQAILPALHLLTGLGLALMVSLRDPLRDTLTAVSFAQGVIGGCVVLALMSLVDFERVTRPFSYVPLLLSFLLSAALILFGTGPGGSDAKVNLLGIQPVELIRLLLLLFLAGYFARNWELLRVLRERHSQVPNWLNVPRFQDALPVLIAVALAILFFFLQKDLGPALIVLCLFLTMYAVARHRYLLAWSGLAALAVGFTAGYWLRFPQTVFQRVSMWLSPWDNSVRGGDQVVHSLWGLSTGALLGAGPGMGDPQLMPAAHTDLILSALGEEWGFIGLLSVFCVYAVFTILAFRIALRSRTDYGFFLALGIGVLTAVEVILIAGGVLQLLPLSGVVTPFLSYGRTSMVANFAAFGILLSVSSRSGDGSVTEPFRAPVRALSIVLAAIGGVLVAKAAYVQVVRADAILGAGTLTVQADGVRRFAYNPRLMAIARTIPRGAIYDRNGLPLASSNYDEILRFADRYKAMEIDPTQAASRDDRRHYPLGATTVHLLGDLRTRANWGARNSSLAERDHAVKLQGYDDRAEVVEVLDNGKPTYTVRYDYRELVPLLRNRYNPQADAVRRVLDRERDLQMSLDARLQTRAAAILRQELQRTGSRKGALVVMNASTGDLLASVSYPQPEMPPRLDRPGSRDEMLDRARYGLYPPGSTFKLVTAIAALNKDAGLASQQYECKRLPDGRVGNFVKGWRRPIRDDVADKNAHGVIAMRQATVVSCNAWFAQLATYGVGAADLHKTAETFGIAVAAPNTPAQLKDALPQAGYGQGQVTASPFQMARVAASIAAQGAMPVGRWVVDESNPRVDPPKQVMQPAVAQLMGEYMRAVVLQGTGRSAAGAPLAIAGKTGTAEVSTGASHAWFAGFAPYNGPLNRRIAFAVIVENGGYGGGAAAPVAARLVAAAAELGVIDETAP